MKKIVLFITCILALTWHTDAYSQEIAPAKTGVQYGKKIDKTGAISVEKLEKALEKSPKFSGKVSGTVVKVCTSSGCFLTLKRSGNQEPIMVRFKDYAYFVPADLIGKNVVLEGNAKIKDSNKEISFIADGILVVK